LHRTLENIFYEVREPRISWDDIGGFGEQKKILQEMVCFVLNNLDNLNRMKIDPPSGVMMWGPLGAGITMLAEAAAFEAQATYVYVSGQEMLGKADKMEDAFAVARQEAPSVLFISDLEWLCPRAGTDYSWSDGNFRGIPPTFATPDLTEKFIALIDEICTAEEVRLLGSSYRVDTVDQAVIKEKKRFNRKIFIPPPGEKDRREIFEIYAPRMPLGDDVDLQELARDTAGYVGWDVESLCRKAGKNAIARGSNRVCRKDFEMGMEEIERWLTDDMVEKYYEIYRRDCPHHYHF
jgi:transitional endoplasmic reticulum ATPase